MKTSILVLLFAVCTVLPAASQTVITDENTGNTTEQNAGQNTATQQKMRARFGALRYDSLLRAMPEYAEMNRQIDELRKQFETEAEYNEMAFKRLYADFLQGQKDFPQTIMLKRQRALQEEMEKGIAFRQSADSLIRDARETLLAPIRKRLNDAITAVGMERGYEFIVNRDADALPFAHPLITEDATPFVVAKLAK